jgi:hypothetical protein
VLETAFFLILFVVVFLFTLFYGVWVAILMGMFMTSMFVVMMGE